MLSSQFISFASRPFTRFAHLLGGVRDSPKHILHFLGQGRENAKRYLARMQGRKHTVYTGVAVIADGKPDVRHCCTDVTFSPMTEREIDWYVSTGEPLDKAGAYGVQGPGGIFVERVEGNYFNVIGLPLPMLYKMLIDAGEVVI